MFTIDQTPLIDAALLAELITEHAKRGEVHAVYALISARDQIWCDNANAALDAERAKPGADT